MIIDAHVHIWGEGWRTPWNEVASLHTLARTRGISPEEARQFVHETWDPDAKALLAVMDRAGVEKAVIFRVDYEFVVPGQGSAVPLEEQAQRTAATVQRHPDRLIWGAGVDPRRPNAVQYLERAITEWGARAVKLYPPAGFYPNDRMCYPIYEKLVERNIPVMFHIGPVGAMPMRSKFAHPLHLDDVAIDFPELRIHAGHGGVGAARASGGWWHEMLAVAELRRNIVIDIASWQLALEKRPVDFFRRLRDSIDVLGPDRILFGTDWTGPSAAPMGPYLTRLQQPPAEVQDAGIAPTEAEMALLLGRNAAAFYDFSR
ncbi:MAG: amidohydrolase [Chloroflexi bacterium]|nr:amidohydrolase [Chloroflexota bacterium]